MYTHPQNIGPGATTLQWRPPAGVVGHNGQPLDENTRFPVGPPPAIGDLLSADSTLRLNGERTGMILRGAFSLFCGAIFGFVFYLVTNPHSSWRGTHAEALAAGLIAGVLASAIVATLTLRSSCSFVGRLGVARCRFRPFRREPKWDLLLFEIADSLRNLQERNSSHGVYMYELVWRAADSRVLLTLRGSYYRLDGHKKGTHWFAKAAENAWSDYLGNRVAQEVTSKGYAEFEIDKRRAVRVGPGFLEFVWKGQHTRVEGSDIKVASLDSGYFHFAHKDARWFSSRGKFDFRYADIANVEVFVRTMHTLLTPSDAKAA